MQGLGSWNQSLKISNTLKTCSTLEQRVPQSPLWIPSRSVEGQQLQQHRVQSPRRQMANAFGKHPFPRQIHTRDGGSIAICLRPRGLGKIRSDCSGIWRFLLWWKCSKMMVVMAAQFCDDIKNHWIVYIKWVNGMMCDLYLNKAVFKSY